MMKGSIKAPDGFCDTQTEGVDRLIAVLGRHAYMTECLETLGFQVVGQVGKLEMLEGFLKVVSADTLVVVVDELGTGGWDPVELARCLGRAGGIVDKIDVVGFCADITTKKNDRALSSSLGTLDSCRWLGLYGTVEEVTTALTRTEPPKTEMSCDATLKDTSIRQKGVNPNNTGAPNQYAHPRHWLGQVNHETQHLGQTSRVVIPHQIIAVYSPKGGVGKTFIACNIAVALARTLPYKVALLDLDIRCADVSLHLDLLNGPTLIDLLPYAVDMCPDILKRYMVQHKPSGLDVLLGPARPELSELVKVEHVLNLLQCVGNVYGYSIVDMGPNTDEFSLECLRMVTRVVLVTTQDAAALRHSKMFLDTIRRLGADLDDKVLLVVNRVEAGSPLSLREIRAFLDINPVVTIEENRKAVEDSVFNGRPLIEAARDEPIARSLISLARQICPLVQEEPGFSQKVSGFPWSWARRLIRHGRDRGGR